MQFIIWIVFGVIVGAIAKLLMPGRDPGGFLITMVIGIVGSFIGGALSSVLFGNTATDGSIFHASGWIMSIVGAIVLLALYRLFTGRRAAA